MAGKKVDKLPISGDNIIVKMAQDIQNLGGESMKTRILSWLLIMSMAFSCLPVTALAAEGTTPAFTPYYEEFDGFKDGDKIVVSGSKIVNHYCTGSTYTITRATVDGYSVMQMNTKDSGRAWVKTKQADFTGDFTVKTRLMVAAGHSSTAIDLRFLGKGCGDHPWLHSRLYRLRIVPKDLSQ